MEIRLTIKYYNPSLRALSLINPSSADVQYISHGSGPSEVYLGDPQPTIQCATLKLI